MVTGRLAGNSKHIYLDVITAENVWLAYVSHRLTISTPIILFYYNVNLITDVVCVCVSKENAKIGRAS